MTIWDWVGLALTAVFVYAIYRHVTRKPQSVPPVSSPQEDEPPKDTEKSKGKRMDKFQGYEWSWPVREDNDRGLPLPHAHHEVQIFLQEIRDKMAHYHHAEASLLQEQLKVQKETLEYLKRTFGGE